MLMKLTVLMTVSVAKCLGVMVVAFIFAVELVGDVVSFNGVVRVVV